MIEPGRPSLAERVEAGPDATKLRAFRPSAKKWRTAVRFRVEITWLRCLRYMAYMYGILSVVGWIALVVVLALLVLIPPRKPGDSEK